LTEQKPLAARSAGGRRPPPPPISDAQKKLIRFQMIYLMISFAMLIVISEPAIRLPLGNAANAIFGPTIGFHYQFPLLTLILSGIIIGLVTSIPRYFFTDWLRYGRTQARSRAYSQAIREAYKTQQRDRIQKLNKMRMEMTMEQQQIQMQTMKPLMVLTILTLFIFIWLDVFIYSLPYGVVSFPWAPHVIISDSTFIFFPLWIVVYFLASLVIGYFATMIIKYLDFTYKLRKIEEKEQGSGQWN